MFMKIRNKRNIFLYLYDISRDCCSSFFARLQRIYYSINNKLKIPRSLITYYSEIKNEIYKSMYHIVVGRVNYKKKKTELTRLHRKYYY